MNPETILEKVCRALDIAIGLGANYEGLFPSIIDRSTHQMMVDMPPAIAGQGPRPPRLRSGGGPLFAAFCHALY